MHLICDNNQDLLLDLNLIYKNLWSGIGNGLISMLEIFNLFCFAGLITLVLSMWKWMGLCLVARKNHLLRCWGWLPLLNWIRALTLSLLLKLPQRNWSLDLFIYSWTLPPPPPPPPLLIKRWGWVFEIFLERGRGHNFPIKREGWSNGSCSKKGVITSTN